MECTSNLTIRSRNILGKCPLVYCRSEAYFAAKCKSFFKNVSVEEIGAVNFECVIL